MNTKETIMHYESSETATQIREISASIEARDKTIRRLKGVLEHISTYGTAHTGSTGENLSEVMNLAASALEPDADE